MQQSYVNTVHRVLSWYSAFNYNMIDYIYSFSVNLYMLYSFSSFAQYWFVYAYNVLIKKTAGGIYTNLHELSNNNNNNVFEIDLTVKQKLYFRIPIHKHTILD